MAEEQEYKYCSNCKHRIVAINFLMHEVHCRRNIVLCEKCEEPVPRSEMNAHFEEEHTLKPCHMCQEQFEISKMDDHQITCPRRKVHCNYCELDMAECDLPGHQNYCGARTEQCPLCSQFVMLRDMEQHQTSVCSYPPRQDSSLEQACAAPNTHLQPNGIPETESFLDPENMGSFAMNELSRLLNEPSMMPPTSFYPLQADSNRRNRQTRSNFESRKNSGRPPQPLHVRRNLSRLKRTNETLDQRNRNINKPPSNYNETNIEQSDATDLDEVLALHLAQDLGSESNTIRDDLLRFSSNDLRGSRPSDAASSDPDDVCLPCEFCGELFPLEFLIQHQGVCNPYESLQSEGLSRPVNTIPSESSMNNFTESVPNNHSPRRKAVVQNHPSHPHILDNLGNESSQSWFSETTLNNEHHGSETLLPCEFCDQLFPDDILVQHQAVCEIDHASMPHLRSAVIPRRTGLNPQAHQGARAVKGKLSSGTKSNLPNASDLSSHRPVRGHLRQGNPVKNSSHTPVDGAIKQVENSRATNRRPSANRRAAIQDKVADSEKQHSMGTRSKDGGRTSLRATSRCSSRRNSSALSGAFASGEGRSEEEGSAVLVHRTLEQLLQDPSCSTDELLAALDKEEKSSKNQRMKEAAIGVNGLHAEELSQKKHQGGTKRRNQRRLKSPVSPDGANRYDPSFPSEPSRLSSKPKLLSTRAADYPGDSNLRLSKPRNTTLEGHSRRTDGTRTPSLSHSSGNRKVKRTNSRPRKAPQGEP